MVLQPKFLAFCDAVRFDDARSFFQKFAVSHDGGSVVQTCWSEQRAQPPTEGGEAVASKKA
jgi:hypothetical protein